MNLAETFQVANRVIAVTGPFRIVIRLKSFFADAPSLLHTSKDMQRVFVNVDYAKTLTCIRKDKRFPYHRLIPQATSFAERWTYFRYSTLVREVEFRAPNNYNVQTYVQDDEGAVLHPLKDWIQLSCATDEIFLHASCVALRGHGVLLAGDSGAGKTHLLVRLLSQGASLVSDERVLLTNLITELPTAWSIPQGIHLRFGIIEEFKQLHNLLCRDFLGSCHATQVVDEESLIEFINNEPRPRACGLTVAPSVLTDAFHVSHIPTTAIKLMVFLKVNKSIGGIRIRDLGPKEARLELEANQSQYQYLRSPIPHRLRETSLSHLVPSQMIEITYGDYRELNNEIYRVIQARLG